MLNDLYQHLSPIAFSLGTWEVRWYGLAYIAGFICAGFIIFHHTKRWKLELCSDDIVSFICACALGLILGARLGYCLFYGNGYYIAHPVKIFAVSEGGMSFHGGLCGTFIAALVFAFIYKIPFLTLADLLACAAPAGLFFGRIANFINGELYGAPTNSSIGVAFLNDGVFYHASQLYEACLEGVALFVILWILANKMPPCPRGELIGVFLTCYAVFRILIEFVRLPDEQIGYFFGSWGTMGQILCLPMLAAGIFLFVWARKHKLAQLGRQKPYQIRQNK